MYVKTVKDIKPKKEVRNNTIYTVFILLNHSFLFEADNSFQGMKSLQTKKKNTNSNQSIN